MNVPGVFYGLTALLFRPRQLLPTLVVDEFSDLPLNLNAALEESLRSKASRSTEYAKADEALKDGTRVTQSSPSIDIRAIILDKDNCFALPGQHSIYDKYLARFRQLRRDYPRGRVLIVSNTAGLAAKDPLGEQASLVEKATEGTPVLRHRIAKPGNALDEIMRHFAYCDNEVGNASKQPACELRAEQVVVVGDRLFTDILMANRMGMYSVWLRCGTTQHRGWWSWTRFERALLHVLTARVS